MRRAQSSVEAVLAAVLLALLLSASAAIAVERWQGARAALQALGAESRRAQGVVEVVALAPLVVACAAAFALACGQLVAQGRAEAGLALVQAADAADQPAPDLRIERRDGRIIVTVRGPLGDASAGDAALRP
jgi:hypothetical protein